MIRYDEATRTYELVRGTDEERARLDATLERAPGTDRWFAPGVQGLGDLVAKVAGPVARALGLKNCRCGERREALNRAVPFPRMSPRGGTVTPEHQEGV